MRVYTRCVTCDEQQVLSLSLSHFTISHSRTLCLPTLPDNTYTIEKSFFARAYTIQTPNSNEQLRPRVVDKERTVARSRRVCQKSLSLSLFLARALARLEYSRGVGQTGEQQALEWGGDAAREGGGTSFITIFTLYVMRARRYCSVVPESSFVMGLQTSRWNMHIYSFIGSCCLLGLHPSKVELVKIAPPIKIVLEKTTSLLVHIHYFISSF